MSGTKGKYPASEMSVPAMFHSRRRHLTSEAWSELNRALTKSARLAAAYQFEQRILSVHEKRHLCPEEARKRVLKAWVGLPKEIHSYFSKFRTAITERSVEYFNNWAKGAIDNGVTEAKTVPSEEL